MAGLYKIKFEMSHTVLLKKFEVINLVEVCLLGCGGMMPLPDRRLTALLLRYNGRLLLIDCGEGTQLPVKMTGWGFKGIDGILLTHFHGDHVAGLPGLLLTMGNSGRVEPLTIVGPPGLAEVVRGLCVIVPQLPFEIRLLTLPEDGQCMFSLGGLSIQTLPAQHSMPCVAYRLELKRSGRFNPEKARLANIPIKFWNRLQQGETIRTEGQCYVPEQVMGEVRRSIKLVYCTDSRPPVGFVEFAEGADLLVMEGMYAQDEMKESAIEKQHMLFSEAAVLAKASNSSELWLTHFSPALKHPEEYISIATDIFPNTKIGIELLYKKICFNEDTFEKT